MIGVFADPSDTRFAEWIKKATERAGFSEEELTCIEAAHKGVRAKEYGSLIRRMDCCIIDVSHKGIVGLSAKLGSLAAGIIYYEGGIHEGWFSPLDSRIILVTRSKADNEKIARYFGEQYTRISIAEGIDESRTTQLATLLKETVATTAPRIFVSYRSEERAFASAVADALESRGAFVWFDEWEIMPGDSIPEAINRGLGWCTHLVLVVDATFFGSRWAKAEYETVLYEHLSGRRRFRGSWNDRPIIPLFLVDPAAGALPPMLARIRGIDCRDRSAFEESITKLWSAVTTIGPR